MKYYIIFFIFFFYLSNTIFSQYIMPLTDEEHEYLNNLETITMAVDPNWIPFEFIDEKGNFIGIAADLIKLVSERIGINIQLVITNTLKETLELSKNGEVLIIPFLNQTPQREEWLIFTDPIFTDPNVFITREEHSFISDPYKLSGKTIVLPTGTSIEEKIRTDYPNMIIKNTDTELEALKIVSERKADMTLSSLIISAYTIRKEGFFNLKIAGQIPEYTNYLRIGILKTESILRDIFNKAIKTISDLEREEIVNKHVYIRLEDSLDYSFFVMLFIFLIFFVLGTFLWNYKLKKLNDERRLLLDNMKIQVWYMINDHTYGFVNREHAEFNGFKVSDISYKDIFKIYPKKLAEAIQKTNIETFKSGKRITFDYWAKDYKGEKRLFYIVKSPITSSTGKVKYIICTAEDITERYKAKEILEKAKKKAEEVSKAKSNFLANMSHEIRTPLNGVIGFAELLRNTNLSLLQKEYVENVFSSAHSLLEIINDILDFSKIEAGKIELEIIKSNIKEIAENVIDIIKLQAHQKKLELLLNIYSDIPDYVYIDPLRIKQILLNLMSNAIKFTKSGEIELKISFNPLNENKGEFLFSVRDTGIGITIEQSKKLFQAFSQADSSTTRKYGGTGLGLIISNLLAEKMGSKIEFQSSSKNGTTFFFNILTEYEKASNKSIDSFNKKALLLMKNKSNVAIIKNMFLIFGVYVDEIQDIPNMLTKIEAFPNMYNLIIVDHKIDDFTGEEIIKIIREKLKISSKKLPAILLQNSKEEIELYESRNDVLILNKPLKLEDIYKTFKEIFQNKIEITLDKRKPFKKIDNLYSESPIILIAEDINLNMILIKNIIQQFIPKPHILEAKTGLEAIEKIKTNNIDLVFMDIQMPELDGISAVIEIRKFDKKIPIIALTAGAVTEEKEKSLKAGMNGFITKPININQIKENLENYLKKNPPI